MKLDMPSTVYREGRRLKTELWKIPKSVGQAEESCQRPNPA